MDAADCAAGQLPGQHIIKPLDVHCFDLTDPLLSKAGTDMVLDVAAVTVQGTGPHQPLLAHQPLIQPLGQGEPALLRQVDALIGGDALPQPCGQLLLGVGVDIAEDGVAVVLVPNYDAALPSAILPLAHHAVTGWSSFCHVISPPRLFL